MRMFRVVAAAALLALGNVAFAASDALLHVVSYGYGADVEKLRVELEYNRQMPQVQLAAVDAGLTRDSHGYRQRSAQERLALGATLS